jgi:hypothetical protein
MATTTITQGCTPDQVACSADGYVAPIPLVQATVETAMTATEPLQMVAPPVLGADGTILEDAANCPQTKGQTLFGVIPMPGKDVMASIQNSVSTSATMAQSSNCTQVESTLQNMQMSGNAICGCDMEITQQMGGSGDVPVLSCRLQQSASATADIIQKALNSVQEQSLPISLSSQLSSTCISQYLKMAVTASQTTTCSAMSSNTEVEDVTCSFFGQTNVLELMGKAYGNGAPCAQYSQINTGVPSLTCSTAQAIKVVQKGSQTSTNKVQMTSSGGSGSSQAVFALMAVMGVVVLGITLIAKGVSSAKQSSSSSSKSTKSSKSSTSDTINTLAELAKKFGGGGEAAKAAEGAEAVGSSATGMEALEAAAML